MTEEQKMQFMMALAQSGANISQINFGDGAQNFFIGKDVGKDVGKATKTDEAQVVDDFSVMTPYVVNQQQAGQLIRWMHQRIDTMTRPKMKLQVVRALYEGGYFTALLPHAVYCAEFGQMSSSTYSEWMGATLNFSTTEMDSVLSDLPEYFLKGSIS